MNQYESTPSRMSRKREEIIGIYIAVLSWAYWLYLLFLIISSAYISIIINRLEDIDLSKIENIKQSSFIYDADDNLITSIYGIENRVNIPLSDIPSMYAMRLLQWKISGFISIMVLTSNEYLALFLKT